MKKVAAAAVAVVLSAFALCACGLFNANVKPAPEAGGDYSYMYGTTALPTVPSTTLPTVTLPPETLPTAPSTTLPTPSGTLPAPTDAPTGPSVPETTLPPETAAPTQAPTDAPSSVVPYTNADGQVQLPVTLPAPNGKMEVSIDPAHPFIRAVSEKRGLNVNVLATVYAVPESGQNYVFEFKDASSRTADDLRRVYLLSADGAIKSVAAADNAERENISPTENWFCMNVLVKKMIFPEIQELLK